MIRFLLMAVAGVVALAQAAAAQVNCAAGLPYPNFQSGNTISSAQVNANFAYITTCFATLGANTFTGAQTLPANPTSALQAATKQYVDSASAGGGSGGAGIVNRFRNAPFVSWPNGTSGTIPTSGSGSSLIAANGWACQATGAAGAWSQQATGQNGNYYALKVAGAASNTGLKCSQRIEATDAALLANKAVTAQVTVKNVTGASLNVQISTCYASAVDNFTTCTADLSAVNMASSACASSSTWTFAYAFSTASGSNTVSNGYSVSFSFGAMTSGSSYVELSAPDIRVTPGVTTGPATAPTPELPPAQIEMARNARYYQTSYENGTAPGSSTYNGIAGNAVSSASQIAPGAVWFPVELRGTPTISYWDGAGNANKVSDNDNGTTWTDNRSPASAPQKISKRSFWFRGSGAAVTSASFLHYTAYADFW